MSTPMTESPSRTDHEGRHEASKLGWLAAVLAIAIAAVVIATLALHHGHSASGTVSVKVIEPKNGHLSSQATFRSDNSVFGMMTPIQQTYPAGTVAYVKGGSYIFAGQKITTQTPVVYHVKVGSSWCAVSHDDFNRLSIGEQATIGTCHPATGEKL